MKSRFFLKIVAFFLALMSLSCSSVPVAKYKDEKPKLVLEEYLAGKTTAYGIFTDRSGEVKKRFVCDIRGVWADQVLTLTEDFKYSDGSKSQRIWKIKKIGPDKYEGTAGDVIGVANGEASGNAFFWNYTLSLDVDGSNYHVKFDDWMYLMNDKVMLNKSAMSKWGFHLGDVTLTFVKE